jgi:hypothetical protein
VFRKYINKRNYQIDEKTETQKYHDEIKNLVMSILGVVVEEAI